MPSAPRTTSATTRPRSSADVFDELDADADGALSKAELSAALHARGFLIPDTELAAMFAAVDTDSSDTISRAEFRRAFSKKIDSVEAVFQEWRKRGAAVPVGEAALADAPPADMPLARFIFAGAAAGASGRLFAAPLERAVIAAQLGQRGGIGAVAQLRTWARDGGIKELYRSAGVNTLRVAAATATVCATYGNAVGWLKARVCASDTQDWERREYFYRALAGGAAGAAAVSVTYPLDVVRTRLAAGGSLAEIISGGRNALSPKALVAGWLPAVAQTAPFVGLQQSIYDALVCQARERGYVSAGPAAFIGCGLLAGSAAHACVYPLEVLRRRAQASGCSARSAFAAALADGGVRALYAGLPASLAAVGPTVAVTLTVRDALLGRIVDV